MNASMWTGLESERTEAAVKELTRQVAELTTMHETACRERDALRALAAGEVPPCRCSCPHSVALVWLKKLETERDALRTEAERLRANNAQMHATAWTMAEVNERDALRAEVEKLRRVAEAAKEMANGADITCRCGPHTVCADCVLLNGVLNALVALEVKP